MTSYPAYLYDAVMLYAMALNETLAEGGSPVNGTTIINKIRNRSYMSMLRKEFAKEAKRKKERNDRQKQINKKGKKEKCHCNIGVWAAGVFENT